MTQLHLGYHELRQYLAKMAEERMTGRATAAPPPNAPAAPSGPRGHGAPPSFAPSGSSFPPPGPPSAGGYRLHGGAVNGYPAPDAGHGASPPRTPLDGPKVPAPEEMPHIGHGDKVKREAGELVEDIKEERMHDYSSGDRERERERDSGRGRDERERRDRDRYAEKDREREEGEDDGRSRRHRDREDRYERHERSDRYERSGRDDRSDRYDKYEDRHKCIDQCSSEFELTGSRSSRHEYDDRERRRDRDRDQE